MAARDDSAAAVRRDAAAVHLRLAELLDDFGREREAAEHRRSAASLETDLD